MATEEERDEFFRLFMKHGPNSFERWREKLPWWRRPFATREAYLVGMEVGARAMDFTIRKVMEARALPITTNEG